MRWRVKVTVGALCAPVVAQLSDQAYWRDVVVPKLKALRSVTSVDHPGPLASTVRPCVTSRTSRNGHHARLTVGALLCTPQVGVHRYCGTIARLEDGCSDPRRTRELVKLAAPVSSLEDLRRGMKVCGTVRNVTHFGAFIDIGLHKVGQDYGHACTRPWCTGSGLRTVGPAPLLPILYLV